MYNINKERENKKRERRDESVDYVMLDEGKGLARVEQR